MSRNSSLHRDLRAAAIVVLAFGLLAACTPVSPAQAPTPPPPAPGPEAAGIPPEPQEGKPLPPVDVWLLKCSMLNSASDDDKAYAATFMLGYRSALLHSRTLDTKRIDAVEQAALADCASNPGASATKVFAVALMRVERAERLEKAAARAETTAARAAAQAGMAPPPMRFTRRRVPPGATPDENQSPPEQKPAEQTQTPQAQTPAPAAATETSSEATRPAEPESVRLAPTKPAAAQAEPAAPAAVAPATTAPAPAAPSGSGENPQK